MDRIGVGFGTAALGGDCYDVVLYALKAGFRKFDTAEADWWYDQKAVGRALKDFVVNKDNEGVNDECVAEDCDTITCRDLKISTKIPPWSLTSAYDIRKNAANSRQELLGFCDDEDEESDPIPLDVYYIHAPKCWNGWHTRCNGVSEEDTLELRESWKAMEAVVGIDHSAERIGLSNISPFELLDIIQFVKERPADSYPPPRMPDVVQAYSDPIRPAAQLRHVCEEHGIEFVSYSTLGTQHRGRKNPVLTSPVVKGLAKKHDRSVAEVVLSWALAGNMSVIPRSSNPQHINELANLLTQPPFLTEEDMEAMNGMALN